MIDVGTKLCYVTRSKMIGPLRLDRVLKIGAGEKMSKPPSKLSQIGRTLENNPEIIFEVIPSGRLSSEFTCFSQVVYFFVAPKTEMNKAKELQKFMMSLIPDLKPTRRENFHEDGKNIYFGKICFEEIIGQESFSHTIILTDTEMLSPEHFVDGKQTIRRVNPVRRQIIVKVFPNARIAKRALAGGDEGQITKKPAKTKRGAK